MLSLIKDSGWYPKGTKKEGHAMIGFPLGKLFHLTREGIRTRLDGRQEDGSRSLKTLSMFA